MSWAVDGAFNARKWPSCSHGAFARRRVHLVRDQKGALHLLTKIETKIEFNKLISWDLLTGDIAVSSLLKVALSLPFEPRIFGLIKPSSRAHLMIKM